MSQEATICTAQIQGLLSHVQNKVVYKVIL